MASATKKHKTMEEWFISLAQMLAGLEPSENHLVDPFGLVEVRIEGNYSDMLKIVEGKGGMNFENLDKAIKTALQIFYWGCVEGVQYPEITGKITSGMIRGMSKEREVLRVVFNDGMKRGWYGKFKIEMDRSSATYKGVIILNPAYRYSWEPEAQIRIVIG